MIGSSSAVQNVRLTLAKASDSTGKGSRPLEVVECHSTESLSATTAASSLARGDNAIVAELVHHLLYLLRLGLIPGSSFLRFLGAAAKVIPRAPEIHDIIFRALDPDGPNPAQKLSSVGEAVKQTSSVPIVEREKVYVLMALLSPGSLMRAVTRCFRVTDVLRDFYYPESPFFSESFLIDEVQPTLMRVARQKFTPFSIDVGLKIISDYECVLLNETGVSAALPLNKSSVSVAQRCSEEIMSLPIVTSLPMSASSMIPSSMSKRPRQGYNEVSEPLAAEGGVEHSENATNHVTDDGYADTILNASITTSSCAAPSEVASVSVRRKKKPKMFVTQAVQTTNLDWWAGSKSTRSDGVQAAPTSCTVAIQTMEHIHIRDMFGQQTSLDGPTNLQSHALLLKFEMELRRKDEELRQRALLLDAQEKSLLAREQLLANLSSRGLQGAPLASSPDMRMPSVSVHPTDGAGAFASPVRSGRSVSLSMHAAAERASRRFTVRNSFADDVTSHAPLDDSTASPAPQSPQRREGAALVPLPEEQPPARIVLPEMAPAFEVAAASGPRLDFDGVPECNVVEVVANQGNCCYKCSLPLRVELHQVHPAPSRSPSAHVSGHSSSSDSQHSDISNDDAHDSAESDRQPIPEKMGKIATAARAAVKRMQDRVEVTLRQSSVGQLLQQKMSDPKKGGSSAVPESNPEALLSPVDGAADDSHEAMPVVHASGYRWCHYTGAAYCRNCMPDGTRSVLPNRIVTKLDAETYPVCLEARDLISRLMNSQYFTIAIVNESVAKLPIFQAVRGLREQLRLLASVVRGQHTSNLLGVSVLAPLVNSRYADEEETYTIADIVSISAHNRSLASPSLLDTLKSMRDTLVRHCALECQQCRKRCSKSCGLCSERRVLYMFDTLTVVCCAACGMLFHKLCAETINCCTECRNELKRCAAS